MNYNLIVIGTGTAAMGAAMRVRKAGWTVAVVDEKPFGGTCALRGAIPRRCWWPEQRSSMRSAG